MKYICCVFLMLLLGCKNTEKKHNGKPVQPQPVHSNLLKAGSVKHLVFRNHEKLRGVKGTLSSFKVYLSSLDTTDVASIACALDYVKTCIPETLPGRDSMLLLFNVKFYQITNKLTDSLETQYAAVLKQMENKPNAALPKAFTDNLKACGIGIFTTEGIYYADVLPNYLYDNFKDRVSVGVKEYLTIRKVELKEGFSEDAGMLIGFDALYGRVKRWEHYLNEQPVNVYTNEANGYYTTYLETLMTGMDNTRAFANENESLLPEVKAIYEKAMVTDTASQTCKVITDYYHFLARHDFKYNDSVKVFIEQKSLYSMLGVQPGTR